MIGTCLVQILIHIERTSVMTDDGIPFRSQYHVRRSDAADTSNLIHTLIILKQRHKSCNASVQRTVHHLIYHICM